MCLFALHNFIISWSLDIFNLKLDYQSRLTIPKFCGYHCDTEDYLIIYNGFSECDKNLCNGKLFCKALIYNWFMVFIKTTLYHFY